MTPRQEALAWERRWAKPVAIAALFAVVLFLVSGFVGAGAHGDSDAELLRSIDTHRTEITLSGAMESVAFALFAFPLAYLFRVVGARSKRVRGRMLGLLVIAPICLAVASGFGTIAKKSAATEFLSGESKSTLSNREATKKCAEKLKEKGAKSFGAEFPTRKGETALSSCRNSELLDDMASNALKDTALASFATSVALVGGIALIIGLFYTSLWAMRTGVLGRFWASLGMALGITVLLGIILFLLVWLAYVGLLIAGWLPGGRPPAWESGEAIPWPTPGERAAADLEGPTEENQLNLRTEDPDAPTSPEKGQSQ